VLVDHELTGLILGLTLSTRAEDVYRALIEATAFGTRKIIEAFEAGGVAVDEFTVAGGLLKNPVIMQIYSDVVRRPLHLIDSDQGPALGSAMHAAVAAGAYPDIHAAAEAMGKVRRDVYQPDEERAELYDRLYELYVRLHDHFGRGGDDVMHALRRIGKETPVRD
jgi:L-ribulokinase